LTDFWHAKLEDKDVCQGAIGQQGPILAQNLRQISALGQTATLICDAVLGLYQAPDVNSYTVPSPAPANPKVWKSSGKAPFHVFHFSDVHIDRQYTVASHFIR
jgi:sphingomyelin phosphodiesterase